jgi:hypothetical protein
MVVEIKRGDIEHVIDCRKQFTWEPSYDIIARQAQRLHENAGLGRGENVDLTSAPHKRKRSPQGGNDFVKRVEVVEFRMVKIEQQGASECNFERRRQQVMGREAEPCA